MPWFDLTAHCLRLDMSFQARTQGLIERVDGMSTPCRFFSIYPLHVLAMSSCCSASWGTVLRRLASWARRVCPHCLIILTRLRCFAIYWDAYRQVSAGFFRVLGNTWLAADLRANGAVSYVMRRFYQILQRWLPFYHQARLAGTIL